MYRPHIRGRNRVLDQQKKAKLCELVAESATIEEAAETLDVSVRTVQRERKEDEDFDHELRLSLQAAPDPLKLMQSAARTHWRAAAWLLERTNPEEYARRPLNSAKAWQVDAALASVLEAALECTPPERRDELYDQVHQACERAIALLFPHLGNGWNDVKRPQLPPTPLANAHHDRRTTASIQARLQAIRDEQGLAEPPEPTAEEVAAQEARAQQRAELRAQLKERLRQRQQAEREAQGAAGDSAGILSPKIDVATEWPDPVRPAPGASRTGRFSDQSEPAPGAAASREAAANDPHAQLAALDHQLRRQAAERRRESMLSRKTRAATKRRKAMKKRSRRQSLAR